MTLVEHLTELRRRVIICAVAFVVAATVAFLLYNHILSFFEASLLPGQCQHHCSLYVTGPLDGLSLRMKIAAYGGLFLASPVILWELWRFITPGLHRKREAVRHPVHRLLDPPVLRWAASWPITPSPMPSTSSTTSADQPPADLQPQQYLSLILLLMALFGLTFEFPVVLVVARAGRGHHPGQLGRWRRWAIVDHHGGRRGLHPQLGSLLDAGPGRAPASSSTSCPSSSGSSRALTGDRWRSRRRPGASNGPPRVATSSPGSAVPARPLPARGASTPSTPGARCSSSAPDRLGQDGGGRVRRRPGPGPGRQGLLHHPAQGPVQPEVRRPRGPLRERQGRAPDRRRSPAARAPVVVMTTEVLRNMLFARSELLDGLARWCWTRSTTSRTPTGARCGRRCSSSRPPE